MKEATKVALLKDLKKLIKKHGPNVISDLEDILKDPHQLKGLLLISEDNQRVDKEASAFGPLVSGDLTGLGGIQSFISKLQSSDPSKAQKLSALYHMIKNKEIFATLRELKNFSSDNGLRRISATSREKAINLFIRDIATRSYEEFQLILDQIHITSINEDRGLEKWTEIIIKKSDESQ